MIKGTTCLICGTALSANSHKSISKKMREHLQLEHPKQWEEFNKMELEVMELRIKERTKLRQRAQQLFEDPDYLIFED